MIAMSDGDGLFIKCAHYNQIATDPRPGFLPFLYFPSRRFSRFVSIPCASMSTICADVARCSIYNRPLFLKKDFKYNNITVYVVYICFYLFISVCLHFYCYKPQIRKSAETLNFKHVLSFVSQSTLCEERKECFFINK